MASTHTVLTVVGARPQFIKSAALTRALVGGTWQQHLLHAGQHADDAMGVDFLQELGVPAPDARLSPSQTDRTSRMADMMRGIGESIRRVRPDVVLVYGDTDATLAGALAAHHAGVPLVHVEAGLRSGDRSMPEEWNRILTDQLSNLWVTTGPGATRQLVEEGMPVGRIVEAGDVMLDVALAAKPGLADRRPPGWPEGVPVLVVTLHRPSLVDDPDRLQGALRALELWMSETGGAVYLPLHPRTGANLDAFGLHLPEGVINPGPLGYLDMQAALHHAHRVLTDSGGLQKEAWFQGAGTVVLRDTTEWRELLDMGASVLFDPGQLMHKDGALDLVRALSAPFEVVSVEEAGLFGGGHAAAEIIRALEPLMTPH